MNARTALRMLLAAFMLGAGAMHFVNADFSLVSDQR